MILLGFIRLYERVVNLLNNFCEIYAVVLVKTCALFLNIVGVLVLGSYLCGLRKIRVCVYFLRVCSVLSLCK